MAFSAGNRLTAAELNALPQVVAYQPTSSAGSATSGTTDTIDSILGTVSVVADGATRYRIEMINAMGSSSVANDHYQLRIRDGGAATPTTASTEIARTDWKPVATGGAGQEGINLSNIVVLSAGTHTFGFFAQRDLGTGVFTPTGDRRLTVSTAGT
jgi:hypothetical protein